MFAHQEALIRQAIARVLAAHGFQVAALPWSLSGLIESTGQHRPSLVLVDAQLPGLTTECVADLSKHTKVAVVSQASASDEAARLIRGGACSVLSFNVDEEHFVEALRLLERGDMVIAGEMAERVAKTASPPAQTGDAESLSNRERHVLGLVAKGATNREIAQELIVTEHTVKVHLRHILEKLDLKNRQQAAVYAVQHQIATASE